MTPTPDPNQQHPTPPITPWRPRLAATHGERSPISPRQPKRSLRVAANRAQTKLFVALFAILFVVASALAGCQTPPTRETPIALPDITYADLIGQYNDNIANLDRIWARALVSIRYRDAAGDRHYVQGESSWMLFDSPDRVTLAISKVGAKPRIYIGANEDQYWLIDLFNEPTAAYVGKQDGRGALDANLLAGLPPRDLTRLIGLAPLDASATDTKGRPPMVLAVELDDGSTGLAVSPPGMRAQLVLEPRSALLRKITLFDPAGRPYIVARLDRPGDVQTEGRSVGAWPRLMTRFQIEVIPTGDELRLHISGLTDARGKLESAKARSFTLLFDPMKLIDRLKPDQVFDLDAKVGGPAATTPASPIPQ